MSTSHKPNVSNQWIDRLKQLMEENGVSTTQDLAYKSGVSAGSLSQAMRGLHVPKQVTIDKIAAALGTTSQYLLYGETKNVESLIPVIRGQEQLLRYLSQDVMDTKSIEWFDAGGFEGVSPDWFALSFSHTDMRPAFVPGDVIIFDRVQADDARWKTISLDKDVYVMAIRRSLEHQDMLFGRLAKTGEGYFIEPLNSQYPPIFVGDEYKIIGIGVHQIRRIF